MKPFFLRRLKADVLQSLPAKTEEVLRVPMTADQHELYFKTVTEYKKRAKEVIPVIIAMLLDLASFTTFFRSPRERNGNPATSPEWEC